MGSFFEVLVSEVPQTPEHYRLLLMLLGALQRTHCEILQLKILYTCVMKHEPVQLVVLTCAHYPYSFIREGPMNTTVGGHHLCHPFVNPVTVITCLKRNVH